MTEPQRSSKSVRRTGGGGENIGTAGPTAGTDSTLARRRFLASTVALGVGGLAGCLDVVSDTAAEAADAAGEAAGEAADSAGEAAADAGSSGPEPRWDFETAGWPGTPAMADGTLYVADVFGGDPSSLYAVSTEDGSREWRYETAAYLGRPVVREEVLYVGGATGVVAVARADGTERWHADPNGWGMHGIAADGDAVYAGNISETLFALSTDDGSQLWEFRVGDEAFEPTVADGTVYFGSQEENYAQDDAETGAVYAVDAADGTDRWRYDAQRPIQCPPTVVDGTVYVDRFAFDAADGTDLWEAPIGGVRTKPVVVDGTVYVGSEDDNVYALSAADGSVQWEFGTGGFVRSRPAVEDGIVYVGSSDGVMYALDAAEGTEQWHFEPGEDIYSGILVDDDTIYVGCTDNRVYAVPRDPD